MKTVIYTITADEGIIGELDLILTTNHEHFNRVARQELDAPILSVETPENNELTNPQSIVEPSPTDGEVQA